MSDQDQGGKQQGLLGRLGASIKAAQAASEERAEANAATHGAVVKKGTFGLKTVEIYESGHVRVGVVLTSKSPFERLRSITFAHQTQDRSALGHLWSSGGLGSKEKRVLLLTIATDQQVHSLSTEGSFGRAEDKLGLALEAAGNAVLANWAPLVPEPLTPEPTAADKLRQIADLHTDGVLSDEEFAAAKAKLLDQL